VRQRSYANGFGQEITLRGGAGKGTNGVEITVADGTRGGPALAPLAKPTQAGIKAEIAARFPGLAMQIVTQPRGNAYGPYGLAVGRRSDGSRCLFAWQWIDDVRAGATGAGRSIWTAASQAAPASVRVRPCRSDATLDQLAAHVDQLTVDLTRRSAQPETLESAAPGPKLPARAARSQPDPDAAPAPEAPRRRPQRAAEARSPAVADAGAASATVWRTDGRRYIAPVQGSATASTSEWARIGRPSSNAQPVGSALSPAGAWPSGTAPAAATPNKPRALDPSLPMRAYLGPGAAAKTEAATPPRDRANLR